MIDERLHDILAEEAARHRVPGAAAGLVVDGEDVIATYGVTSVENPLPVDGDTLFIVGSISKLFTALAVMQLVDDALVALDDPVGKHLPDLADETGLDTTAITVEHLLSHQAGFDGDVLFADMSGLLSGVRRARRFFAPGTGFSYNNAAFSVAGALVAAVRGEPYEDVVRQRILKPLGMRKSCFAADRAIFERVALPHYVLPGEDPRVLRAGGWQPGWQLTPTDWPAGGLASSVREQLAFARYNLGLCDSAAAPLVSAEGLARLHAPVVDAEPGIRCGLDWHRWQVSGGVDVIGHGGLTVGYCSDLSIVPERGLAFCCYVNSTNGGLVHMAVRRRVFAEIFGLPEIDPAAMEPALSGEALAEYEGTYEYAFGPIDVTVAGDGHPGELMLKPRAHPNGTVKWQPPPDPAIHVTFSARDEAFSTDQLGARPRPVRFGRDDAGKVAWLVYGGRRCPLAAGPGPA